MSRRIIANGTDIAMSALVPARTESYSPIPHSYFLTTIQDQLGNNGLQVKNNRIYTNHDGSKLVGFTTVNYVGMETDPEFGLEMMLGYKNSYDKSMAAALVAGLQVMICENGCIAGDMVRFKRKHTGNIQEELIEKTREAITAMTTGFSNLVLDIDIMKDYQLTQKQKAELLGVMYFEEEMVSPTQLSIIKKEMKESNHFRGNTLWDLYNNVTESLKTSHPFTHIEDHQALHTFMRRVAGIENLQTVEVEPTEGV